MLLLAMAFTSCGEKDGKEDEKTGGFDAIEKEWKLVSVDGIANDFTVYISFTSGTFAIYQQVYNLNYEFFDGEYKVEGNTLSGSYFDGGAWKSAYTGGISNDGNTMTLKSKDEHPVTYVYEACTIPEEVKAEATTRSGEVIPFL